MKSNSCRRSLLRISLLGLGVTFCASVACLWFLAPVLLDFLLRPTLVVQPVNASCGEALEVTAAWKTILPSRSVGHQQLVLKIWCKDGTWSPVATVLTDAQGVARVRLPAQFSRQPGSYVLGWKEAASQVETAYRIATLTILPNAINQGPEAVSEKKTSGGVLSFTSLYRTEVYRSYCMFRKDEDRDDVAVAFC